MAFSQEQTKISGKIERQTGTPALGVPVKLLKDGKVQDTTYTNQAGKFSFEEVKEHPSAYNLEIGSTSTSPGKTIPLDEKSYRGQTIRLGE